MRGGVGWSSSSSSFSLSFILYWRACERTRWPEQGQVLCDLEPDIFPSSPPVSECIVFDRALRISSSMIGVLNAVWLHCCSSCLTPCFVKAFASLTIGHGFPLQRNDEVLSRWCLILFQTFSCFPQFNCLLILNFWWNFWCKKFLQLLNKSMR